MKAITQNQQENLSDFLDRLNLISLWANDIIEEVGLGAEGFGLYDIDEIALMGQTQVGVMQAITKFVTQGHGVLFNVARDSVVTAPIPSAYDVEYSFLQPNAYSWRIEFMRLLDGVSPLHAPLESMCSRASVPLAVHASFKCRTMAEYDKTVTRMADYGMTLAQANESSYGRFSYWRTGSGEDEFPLYLKPRVNLRDAS